MRRAQRLLRLPAAVRLVSPLAIAALAVPALLAPAPALADPTARLSSAAVAAGGSPFPFEDRIAGYLAGRPGSVGVAVYDNTTGATYGYRATGSYVTASIVKVDILTTLLRQRQQAGLGLSASEQSTASLMIRNSDNTAATTLWNLVGQGPAIADVNRLIGMPATAMGTGGYWGLTSTTALDQVALVRTVAYPNPVLGDPQRGYLESLMRTVSPDQAWGVSAGPPAGVSVALKNGWLPMTGGWEVNSIGHLVGAGRDYVIAVLSFGSASMGDGVATLQGVASLVWQQLGAGPVAAKYAALGGARSVLGPPTTAEFTTPDGTGRFTHYTIGSIYWTPTSGAHEVHGAIRDEWAARGWERQLGYPLTDETVTPDGIGRYNHFTGASIYWTPSSGAHEVHGAIRDAWAALGWERELGYPVTDETTTPDGIGRYNHFTGGSIYWSPSTGAHDVRGLIRQAWAAQGWETGRLGYPLTGEYAVPGGRRSDFVGGSVTWIPATGISVTYR